MKLPADIIKLIDAMAAFAVKWRDFDHGLCYEMCKVVLNEVCQGNQERFALAVHEFLNRRDELIAAL